MNALKPHRKRKSYSLVVFLLGLFIFLSFSTWQNFLGFRSFLQACFYPFQITTVSTWRFVVDTPGALLGLRSLSQENLQLKNELSQLKPQMALLNEQVSETNRLRALLSFKQVKTNLRLLPAQVIGRSPSPWFTILEIDKGAKSGLKKNLAVISESGLVGRVVEVSAYTAKIMLISDVSSSVPAVAAATRDLGVVVGGSGNKLMMRYVSAGAEVKPGDKILTSEISEFYPAGLMIGTVVSATKKEQDLFYTISLKPAVDFGKLEAVFVLY